MTLSILGQDGDLLDLDDPTITGLNRTLRGDLLNRDHPDFAQACALWNGMIEKRPRLIARCAGAADVRDAVNFASEHQIELAVRGGGHNVAGSAICDDGMVIDLSRMRGVVVDPHRQRVIVEPGCTWAEVDRETQAFGLAVPNGIVSTTGVSGLTLGGGFGWLTRKYGLTSDNLRSAQVVTADGNIVTASDERNEDLFWGIRGGGGNFGVVTCFEFEAQRHGPEVMAGIVVHPREHARDVLEFYREFTADAPDEVGTLLVLRHAPPKPFLEPAVHGEPIAAIAACYAGPVEEGREALAPVKEFGEPLGDAITPKPFRMHQSMFDGGNPHGRRYYWKSEYVDRLDDGLVDVMLDSTARMPSPHSAMLFFHLGGEAARTDPTMSAAPHRDANYVLNISAAWDGPPSEDERHINWAREFHRRAQPFAHGGVYVNFLTEEEGSERVRQAYGPKKWARLREIKGKHDPQNLFRVNKNIPPAATFKDPRKP